MISARRLFLPFLLSFLGVLLLVLSGQQAAGEEGATGVEADVSAEIIITFAQPVARTVEARQLAIAATQHQILSRHQLPSPALSRRYVALPMLALSVNAAQLAQLQQDGTILSIEPDLPLTSHLEDAVPNTGATYIHETFSIKGAGPTVVIFDSGFVGNHPDFSISRTRGQQCFTDGDCWASGSFSADEGLLAEDNNGHGTNVTGIIASNGTRTIPGFAPKAQIIPVRVLDRNAEGRLSDLIAGFDWLIDSFPGFAEAGVNIRLANLSMGNAPSQIANGSNPVGLHSGSCASFSTAFNTALNTLRGKNMIFFASSGNDSSSTQIAFPACHPDVIAVGASYDGGSIAGVDVDGPAPGCSDPQTTATTVACFSNSNAQIDLIAPGAIITASGLMSSTSTYLGTSQASAAATGIAALLLEVDPTLTQAQLLHVMTSTATTVTDSKNGLTFPLINARAAVESLLPKVYIPIAIKP